jgi:hypothetical protein
MSYTNGAIGFYGKTSGFQGGEDYRTKTKEQLEAEHKAAHIEALKHQYGEPKPECGHYRCNCVVPDDSNEMISFIASDEADRELLDAHKISYKVQRGDHWQQPLGAEVPGYYGPKWVNKPTYKYTLTKSDYDRFVNLRGD